MASDQQFRLRWNNHRNTILNEFRFLLEKNGFVDCTIGADGKYIKVHKVVLSACSTYLQSLLLEQPVSDKHPIILLKDVTYKELSYMVDYMYRGEVNIRENELPSFLKAAQSLRIRGLAEDDEEGESSKAGSDTNKLLVCGEKTGEPPTKKPAIMEREVITKKHVELSAVTKRDVSKRKQPKTKSSDESQICHSPDSVDDIISSGWLGFQSSDNGNDSMVVNGTSEQFKSNDSEVLDQVNTPSTSGGPSNTQFEQAETSQYDSDISDGGSTYSANALPDFSEDTNEDLNTSSIVDNEMEEDDQNSAAGSRGYPTRKSSKSARSKIKEWGRPSKLYNDSPRKHQCHKCYRWYQHYNSLKRHLEYECGIAPSFKCPYCDHLAQYQRYLNKHIVRRHNMPVQSTRKRRSQQEKRQEENKIEIEVQEEEMKEL